MLIADHFPDYCRPISGLAPLDRSDIGEGTLKQGWVVFRLPLFKARIPRNSQAIAKTRNNGAEHRSLVSASFRCAKSIEPKTQQAQHLKSWTNIVTNKGLHDLVHHGRLTGEAIDQLE